MQRPWKPLSGCCCCCWSWLTSDSQKWYREPLSGRIDRYLYFGCMSAVDVGLGVLCFDDCFKCSLNSTEVKKLTVITLMDDYTEQNKRPALWLSKKWTLMVESTELNKCPALWSSPSWSIHNQRWIEYQYEHGKIRSWLEGEQQQQPQPPPPQQQPQQQQ